MNNKLAIVVDEDIIEKTKSEKLLGVIINDKLTWKEHLHCDNENEGLITRLKEKVIKIYESKRLVMLLGGIFTQNFETLEKDQQWQECLQVTVMNCK